MSHNEGMNTLTGRPDTAPTLATLHKQRITSKLHGYGEGIVHGWELAAAKVSEATNGLFTLQEPREVTEWRARLKRSVIED